MTERSARTPRRGGRRPRCRREGCPRRALNGYPHCSQLCWLVDEQLTVSQRVCEVMGPDVSSELWASVVELNDALSTFLSERVRVRRVAHDAGITADQWSLIRNGTYGGGDNALIA